MKYKGNTHVDNRSGMTLSTCNMNCLHNIDKIPLYTVYLIEPISQGLTKEEAQHLLLNYKSPSNHSLEIRQKGFKPKLQSQDSVM